MDLMRILDYLLQKLGSGKCKENLSGSGEKGSLKELDFQDDIILA